MYRCSRYINEKKNTLFKKKNKWKRKEFFAFNAMTKFLKFTIEYIYNNSC